jgi:hypothetical protein
MKITKDQLENCDLTHRHAGNGWTMVQDIDATHCRVAFVPKVPEQGQFGGRAFLAHKDMLEATIIGDKFWPVKPEYMEAIVALRGKLASGELVVRSTHVVKP